MIEQRLIKKVNTQISITNQENEAVFAQNYNGLLKVAVLRIHFSEDCFNYLLDVSSKELVTTDPINFSVYWKDFTYKDSDHKQHRIFNLPSILTNIHFNKYDYVKDLNKNITNEVFTFQPTHLEFKECNFVNLTNCTIYIRDILNNVLFAPKFFMLELLFTNDPSTYIDEDI